jgi:hypothetical protein
VTIRDPEVLELLREEPELLAVADAVAATQRPRRRHLPSRRLLLTAAAAVAAGATVLAAPWQRGDGGDLVARALAAVRDRPVTHAVLVSTLPSEQVVDVTTGELRPAVTTVELWYDRTAGRLRTVVRRRGKVVSDVLETARAGQGSLGLKALQESADLDAGMLAFATGYRRALADGKATVIDEDAVLSGEPVHWLRVTRPLGTEDVAVARDSYTPVAIRPSPVSGATPGGETRVKTFETLPSAGTVFTPRARSGLEGVYGGEASRIRALTPREVPDAFSPRALWPGPTASGLPLRRLELERLSRFPLRRGADVGEGRGLEATYGDLTPRGTVDIEGTYVRIKQTTQPEPAYGFLSGELELDPVPPPGSATLSFQANAHDPGAGSWQARFRRDGLWLLVDGAPKQVVLDAIRGLRRFPA